MIGIVTVGTYGTHIDEDLMVISMNVCYHTFYCFVWIIRRWNADKLFDSLMV